METETFPSFYNFHKYMIEWPSFKDVKIKGNDDVLCPYCRMPMKIIYQKGKVKFYQCPHIHKGKRFVYMVG
jgi:predicted RNA methylase